MPLTTPSEPPPDDPSPADSPPADSPSADSPSAELPLRDRLVEAGAAILEERGIGALGLREIARRAGVSHGAPRRYFPTHHALLSAIARRGFGALAVRLERAAGEGTPRAQLRAMAVAYVAHAREHRGMFELMFRHELLDSGGTGSGGETALRTVTLPLFGRFAALVAQHRGLPDDDPKAAVTAAALWSGVHGIAQLWAWGSLQLVLDVPDSGEAGPLVDTVLDAHLGPDAA